jgi:hypothetical protein
MKRMNNKPALTPSKLEGDHASFNKGEFMINYRRFARSRLLSIRVGEFQTASFPVEVKSFRVTKAKTKAGKTKTLRQPIAYARVNPKPAPAGDTHEIVPRSNA